MAEDLSGFSMLELFRLEAESQTAILSAGILAIEELQRSPRTIESMMRAAHSLKGAARIVGLDPAVRVSHALEDCFVAAGKGLFRVRPAHAVLFLNAIDFLSTIARADDALTPDSPWASKATSLAAELSEMLHSPVVESPQERQAAGKELIGTIRLEARHRAGMLQITLSDDGRGIDIENLRSKAVTRGLVAKQVADQLSEVELLEFLFLPGFSTKDNVTEISGRGVGLDVVQSMVKAVGGSVRVATQLGRQTTFTLQLPITMSVIRALLVSIGGEPYAFPLTRIDQIIFCHHADIRTVEGRQYFQRDGVSIGLVMAAQILETSATASTADPMPIVVVSDRGQQFGMIVDAFLGERDLEVRPLDPRLGKVPDINSASLLENGNPVLIVDVDDLVRSIDNVLMGRRLSRVEFERLAEQSRTRKRILVVDDSITVRELERQLLQSRGFSVDVAVDGMDGWNAVRGTSYDLIVSDVDMPRMDGIELVSLIKSDPLRKDIPVVIVSYKDREEDRLRGLEAGANRYLTKSSFHDETFLNTIIDLIGEPSS